MENVNVQKILTETGQLVPPFYQLVPLILWFYYMKYNEVTVFVRFIFVICWKNNIAL